MEISNDEHWNFINKLTDRKIPRQNQWIANRLFMKNFSRETTNTDIEQCFQSFGDVHDVKIIAKENTHFAFISFVNDSTAFNVLRQHAIIPITFQNRPIILAPAYKKMNPSLISTGSTMTPPSTPSRYQQPVYSPIYFPIQTNMPFMPMTGTYLTPSQFYPTFYTQNSSAYSPTGSLLNGQTYMSSSPYMHPMTSSVIPGSYSINHTSITNEY